MAGKHQEQILTPLDSVIENAYVRKFFFFPRSEHDQISIVQNLRSALAKTLEAIPLLAGSIQIFPRMHQKGRFGITAPWRDVDEILTVQDLTESDFLDYGTLRAQHFPMVRLNDRVLIPFPKPGSPPPVLTAQVNFIKGGLILGMLLHHDFTDGVGSVPIVKVWAAYCRGDDGAKAIAADSLDRTRLMEGTRDSNLGDFPEYIYLGEPDNSSKMSSTYQRVTRVFRFFESWTTYLLRLPIKAGLNIVGCLPYFAQARHQTVGGDKDGNSIAREMFFFPRAKLNELKELAAKGETDTENVTTDWISTNDALASLLWCCIIAAKKKREEPSCKPIVNKAVLEERKQWLEKLPVLSQPSPSEPVSGLGFLINARSLMEPPMTPDFIGNVVLHAGITVPLGSVNSSIKCISESAKFLRRRIRQFDGAHLMRVIGAINAVPDLSKVSLTRGPFPELVVVVNSWANQGFYDINWGSAVGGHCDRVRIPPSPFEDFCLVFPRLDANRGYEGGDGLEVEICIKTAYMESLKQDQLFKRFAVWRCY